MYIQMKVVFICYRLSFFFSYESALKRGKRRHHEWRASWSETLPTDQYQFLNHRYCRTHSLLKSLKELLIQTTRIIISRCLLGCLRFKTLSLIHGVRQLAKRVRKFSSSCQFQTIQSARYIQVWIYGVWREDLLLNL